MDKTAGFVPSQKESTWFTTSFNNVPTVSGCRRKESRTSDDPELGPRRKIPRTLHSLPTVSSGRPDLSKKGARHKPGNPKREALWVDKYQPLFRDDLAVHKKKIGEVSEWFEEKLHKPEAALLLLTGPAGAGKTATVNVLSHEMNFEIQQWTNKAGLNYIYDDTLYSNSQMDTFKEFLLRAARYSSCQIPEDNANLYKILLMEEFPQAAFKDSSEFHRIIRQYKQIGRCPLVFILTDSKADDNERRLFPKGFQAELNITNISFNPVAPTSLFRAVSRVTASESLEVEQATIKALTENCHGDVRAAINALQFRLRKDAKPTSKFVKNKRSNKRGKTTNPDYKTPASISDLSIGGRDDSLFLFHALGKVLHCKRDTDRGISSRLQPSLKDMERHPLLVDPESVWSRTSISANNFLAFLHQNYLMFFSDIEDVVRASAYLSAADCFNSQWTPEKVLDPYILSVTSRGLMHCQKAKSTSGWKPLNKPAMFSVDKLTLANKEEGVRVFKGHYLHLSREDLFSQLIPRMQQIRCRNLSSEQRLFVENVGGMKDYIQKCHWNQTELLDEKEILIEEGSNHHLNELPSSEPGENVAGDDPDDQDDDDMLIEEYDD